MKDLKKDLRIFHGIIILLLLLTVVAVLQPQSATESKKELYPHQSEVLKKDTLNKWIRENIAGSVLSIKTSHTIDIQLFNVPDKKGKPIFRVRKALGGSLGAGTVIKDCQGCLLSVEHVVKNVDSSKKLDEMVAQVQKESPGLYVEAKIVSEYALVDRQGNTYPARVVMTGKNDLSLVQAIDWKHFSIPGLAVYNGKDFMDKEAVVIGEPLGHKDTIFFDVHTGNGDIYASEDGKYTLITAPVLPGNSGGPVILLYNMKLYSAVSSVVISGKSLTSLGYVAPNDVINEFLKKAVPKAKR